MKYIVINKFRDLQDNGRVYNVGDVYEGKKTKARLGELSTDKNKTGKPLIKQEK